MYHDGMDDKRTMTLNLTAREMDALEELAARKEMSKTAILRHALRLFQLVDAKLARGGKLFLEDDKNRKAELLVL
jgi:hypothetical protein